MVEIRIRYEGDLHGEAVHVPSGVKLVTDAPKDSEGRGESFSPTDLVATALGTCMVTIMGMVARRRGIPLEGTEVRVLKHMVADPDRRIGRLELSFAMSAGIEPGHRKLLESAALTCPVKKSLRAEIEIPIEFRYPD